MPMGWGWSGYSRLREPKTPVIGKPKRDRRKQRRRRSGR